MNPNDLRRMWIPLIMRELVDPWIECDNPSCRKYAAIVSAHLYQGQLITFNLCWSCSRQIALMYEKELVPVVRAGQAWDHRAHSYRLWVQDVMREDDVAAVAREDREWIMPIQTLLDNYRLTAEPIDGRAVVLGRPDRLPLSPRK